MHLALMLLIVGAVVALLAMNALSVTGQVNSVSSATESMAVGPATTNVNTGLAYKQSFNNGTGAGNIQEYWTTTSTPAASTPDNWVLSALTQSISGGGTRTIAFTKVRHLKIINLDTVDGHTLTLTAAATHPVGWLPLSSAQGIVIPAGGCLELTAPGLTALGITSGTADSISINPGANAGNYSIEVWGE